MSSQLLSQSNQNKTTFYTAESNVNKVIQSQLDSQGSWKFKDLKAEMISEYQIRDADEYYVSDSDVVLLKDDRPVLHLVKVGERLQVNSIPITFSSLSDYEKIAMFDTKRSFNFNDLTVGETIYEQFTYRVYYTLSELSEQAKNQIPIGVDSISLIVRNSYEYNIVDLGSLYLPDFTYSDVYKVNRNKFYIKSIAFLTDGTWVEQHIILYLDL